MSEKCPALEPTRSASEYKFDEWVSPPGLPYPSVRAMGQDEDGYLWFGTRSGMARFDGLALTRFAPDNLPVMPASGVQAFARDAQGVFWAGTDKGLLRYRDRIWAMIGPDISEPIGALLFEPNGPAWAATSSRLYQIRGEKLEPFPTPGITFTAIRGLVRCSNGDLVVVGAPTVLIHAGEARALGLARGMSHDNSTAVAVDREGGTWIGTARGLHYYRDGTVTSYSTKDGLPVNGIRSLLIDRDNNLWIGTASGLTRRTDGKFETTLIRGDERISHVLCMMEDKEGNVWLGTDTGFARLTDVAFTHVGRRQGLLSDAVACVLHAKDGSAWVSTLGGGVTNLSPQGAKTLRPGEGLLDDTVISLEEDGQGGLWCGYIARGITWYHDGKFTHYFERKDTDNREWAVAVEPGGQVWAANNSTGLMRFNGTDFELVPCPGLERPRLVKIDGMGALWVAGGNGVGRLWKGEWRFMPMPPAAAQNLAQAIILDPTDGIWVLRGRGEIHRHTERGAALVAFDVAEVGPLSYGGLIFRGDFWINIRFGLLRVPVAQMMAVAEGRAKTPSHILYDETWGMKSRAPNVAGFPSVSADPQGRIWSTTSRGLAMVDPDKIPFNAQPPKVVIERVLTDKLARPFGELGRIPPGRGEIVFKYTALSLTESQRVQFKYRLTGFEKSWSAPTRDREAYYGGLPPGRYRFEVLASNNDNVWSTRPVTLDLRILPFFYQRLEFQVLGAVLLIAGVLGLIRWRVHAAHRRALALQEQNLLLEKRIAERTAELERSYEALKESQRELIEASRMAGIAEMATGVLHNIGNGLNSVKTSSGVAASAIRHIRSNGIAKVTQLLRDQGEHIGEFLLHDPKGRQLPDYLTKTAGHIEEQKNTALDELGVLELAVGDVAEIVAAQQELAHTSGLVETVSPAGLIESALRLTDVYSARSRTKVLRELPPVPSVRVDRQKTLQILGCLVRNAVVAATGLAEPARQITIGVRSAGPGRVAIYVADAGLGLASEDLVRIFAFGFAKKPGDYGFGIHTSALAAKEMGGALTVESAGPGRGATFTLQLPAGCDGDTDAAL